jgi:hypothetical protein
VLLRRPPKSAEGVPSPAPQETEYVGSLFSRREDSGTCTGNDGKGLGTACCTGTRVAEGLKIRPSAQEKGLNVPPLNDPKCSLKASPCGGLLGQK